MPVDGEKTKAHGGGRSGFSYAAYGVKSRQSVMQGCVLAPSGAKGNVGVCTYIKGYLLARACFKRRIIHE